MRRPPTDHSWLRFEPVYRVSRAVHGPRRGKCRWGVSCHGTAGGRRGHCRNSGFRRMLRSMRPWHEKWSCRCDPQPIAVGGRTNGLSTPQCARQRRHRLGRTGQDCSPPITSSSGRQGHEVPRSRDIRERTGHRDGCGVDKGGIRAGTFLPMQLGATGLFPMRFLYGLTSLGCPPIFISNYDATSDIGDRSEGWASCRSEREK